MAFSTLMGFLVKASVPVGLAAFGEHHMMEVISTNTSVPILAGLFQPISASLGTFSISRAYALVALINIIDSSLAMMYFGIIIGDSRKKYGVNYPHLYAKGDDEKSIKFNCMQRGHQSALELHGIFMACSLVAGLRHPILTSCFGVLWIASRISFFNNYAKGDASKRYQGKLSHMHWGAVTAIFVLAASTCCGLLNLF